MNARFRAHEGEEKAIEMGCYGLGVGRILACAIEVMSDEHGLIFPRSLAPYQCIVIPIGQKGDSTMTKEAG